MQGYGSHTMGKNMKISCNSKKFWNQKVCLKLYKSFESIKNWEGTLFKMRREFLSTNMYTLFDFGFSFKLTEEDARLQRAQKIRNWYKIETVFEWKKWVRWIVLRDIKLCFLQFFEKTMFWKFRTETLLVSRTINKNSLYTICLNNNLWEEVNWQKKI